MMIENIYIPDRANIFNMKITKLLYVIYNKTALTGRKKILEKNWLVFHQFHVPADKQGELHFTWITLCNILN